MLLISTAYQAGHPTVSLSVITVGDPVAGSVIGLMLFGEHLRLQGARGPCVVQAAAAMGGGLITLGGDHGLVARSSAQLSEPTWRPHREQALRPCGPAGSAPGLGACSPGSRGAPAPAPRPRVTTLDHR